MTTLEPGASVVFTQGLVASPASTAFLASSAAPTMTDGFEVLVHDVMAAITTEPWSTEVCRAVLQRHLGRVGRPAGAGGHWPPGGLVGVAVLPVRRERVGRREGVGHVLVQPVELHVVAERLAERLLGVGQGDPVLRPLRPGQRRARRWTGPA